MANAHPEMLYAAVARRLAGLPVRVEFRYPPFKRYSGWAGKDLRGEAVVILRPDLSQPETLRLFCHELAHVKLHFQNYQPTDLDLPGWSIDPGWMYDPSRSVIKAAESEADQLARRWLAYAEKHRKPDNRADIALLTPLLSYGQITRAQLERMIHDAVKSALSGG